ncbi:MAG: hypothetical protein PHS92_03175 [Candidatus Gracilibacteria bacterium]|nr:hypothetical protein [Candidatus Gracilibacteria bacterium]
MTTYNDLINVPSFGKKKENFNAERGDVQFYCRDCRKVVEATRLNPNKYIYECNVCKQRNISIGTKEGLVDFYEGN